MLDIGSNQNSSSKQNEWLFLNAVIWVTLLLYIGVATLLLAGILYRFRPKQKHFLALNFISIVVAIVTYQTSEYTLIEMTTPTLSWWLTLPLFPLVSVLIQGALMFSRFSKPKSQQEQLAQMEADEQKQLEKLGERASKRTEIQEQKAIIRLGSKIKGDRFPRYVGVQTRKGWLTINEDILDQHLFVLGTTGAGKSESIKRLVYEVMSTTDRHVYLVDGKGDEELANDIRALAYKFGRGVAPVYKLGFEQRGAIYDAFRGTPADIYNRLCALLGTSDVEGGAEYYADINRDLLQLICYSPLGAPSNFEQIRQRISKEWLREAYKDDASELEAIEGIDDKSIQGLLYRIRPLAREFDKSIGEEGFAIENTKCAIFSLRVQSVGDSAKRQLNMLVEDLKDVIGKRMKHPAILVIDEFAQFSNDNITALLSLARSANMGVILATQDTAGLKDERTKRLILANTRTKILMATDFPEEVAQLAGTIFQFESSLQLNEGDLTGMGSARIQHTFKISPNEVAKLRPGEAFLIRQRYAAKIQVRRIKKLPHIAPQQPELRQRRELDKKTKTLKRPRPM